MEKPLHKPKKALGQNFLEDETYVFQMIDAMKFDSAEKVVEIGGGTGALTDPLSKVLSTDSSLDVFEIDPNLVKFLKSRFSTDNRVKIISENFLDYDLNKFSGKWKLVGSIPYYITSPIIHKFLRLAFSNRPEVVVLLIQKEVGEKLISDVPSSSYWTHITLGYKVEKISIVPREVFNPAPKVDSMIVRLTKDESGPELYLNNKFADWEKFLHHGYKNPRKMLNKAFEKELLSSAEINPADRPQNLSTLDWIKLFKLRQSK